MKIENTMIILILGLITLFIWLLLIINNILPYRYLPSIVITFVITMLIYVLFSIIKEIKEKKGE